MNTQDYQRLAMITANRTVLDTDEKRFSNAGLGLIGEVGEVADLIKKHYFHGHSLDTSKFILEVGDILWYCALLCETLGITFTEAMTDVEPPYVYEDGPQILQHALYHVYRDSALLLFDLLRWKPENLQGVFKGRMTGHLGSLLSQCDELLKLVGSSLDEAMEKNIEKLQERYPEGFTSEASIGRNAR